MPYKRIATFNHYFYKNIFFLDWLLDLVNLFDYENISDRRKPILAFNKLSEYTSHWCERI